MPLLTLELAKEQLNITTSGQDATVQLWADAATSAVAKALGRAVDEGNFTEEVDLGSGGSGFVLSNVPITGLTSVEAVDGSQTWDVDDLHVNADAGAVSVLSGPSLRGKVAIAYTAGVAVPPANWTVAGLIILQHLWETRRGTMGVSRGGDGEVYMPQLGYAVPRRAVELLGLSLPGVA